jgi:hypothetical protein
MPRTTMGGGYRLKSAGSCRESVESLHIGPSYRNRPTPSPRTLQEGEKASSYPSTQDVHRLHQPVRSSNQSQVKQTRREQETAEIEREYIHNLQKQVYFLELELDSVKQQQAASPTREAGHCATDLGAYREDVTGVVEDLKSKLLDIEQRYAISAHTSFPIALFERRGNRHNRRAAQLHAHLLGTTPHTCASLVR